MTARKRTRPAPGSIVKRAACAYCNQPIETYEGRGWHHVASMDEDICESEEAS